MAAFSEAGDPTTTLAKAYLLDCPFDEEAVKAEAAKFVIVDFDPVNGVTIAGGKAAGDEYGNGHVEVRTSQTLGGDFDKTDKAAGTQLFYKAYLVR